MTDVSEPANRLRFGKRLKALRVARDLTQGQVAAQLGWSQSKVLRMESGQCSAHPADLRHLLDLYEVDGHERDRLAELAGTYRTPRAWASYRDVLSAHQIAALGDEAVAMSLRGYESTLLPDLLQTSEYAECLLGRLRPVGFPDIVPRRLDLLRARQERLDDGEVRAHFVIAEETFLRGAHGLDPFIVSAQLDALIEAGGRPAITIQILPLSAGIHSGAASFTLYSWSDDDADTALWLGGDLDSSPVRADSPDRVHRYADIHAALARRALDPDQSLSDIRSIAAAVRRASGRS